MAHPRRRPRAVAKAARQDTGAIAAAAGMGMAVILGGLLLLRAAGF